MLENSNKIEYTEIDNGFKIVVVPPSVQIQACYQLKKVDHTIVDRGQNVVIPFESQPVKNAFRF